MDSELAEQKLEKAILRGAMLMVDNNLGNWKIKLNNKRSSLAETWHKEKTITYSKYFVMVADKGQFEGVTLHEIAHALLGRGHGHDGAFRKLCTEISPTTEYVKRSVNVPIRKYLLTCPRCGYHGSHNSNKTRYCGVCFKGGHTIKMDIEENALKVRMW